jgi:hypothetical protein
LLPKLGLANSCHIVLDDQHLLSDDFGAWPKKSGKLWPRLKSDCVQLVKSYDEDVYDTCLGRVREQVEHSSDLMDYVERKIHCIRHMFAIHVIQHYDANLGRQGNAPAEANHSSIRQRLGESYNESPLLQIHALLRRHSDISTERHSDLEKYHRKTMAETYLLPDGIEKRACMALSSWGMELFRSCISACANVERLLASDGNWIFVDKNDDCSVTIKLHPSATSCSCRFRKSFHLQCSHLLILHQRFRRNLCSRRWWQLSELGTSAGHGQHDLRADVFSVAGGYVCGDEINLECQTVEVAPTRDRHIGLSQILDVANDRVLAVASVSKKALREHFVAVIINLTEVVKGNVDAVQGMSLENVSDGHFSMYEHTSAQQKLLPCNASPRERTAMNVEGTTGEVESTRQEMKRACPVPPNNNAKARKKSKREIINHQMMAAKPIVLVVLGRGPQGNGVQMQGCDVVQGKLYKVERRTRACEETW